jgi:hypothetical protein
MTDNIFPPVRGNIRVTDPFFKPRGDHKHLGTDVGPQKHGKSVPRLVRVNGDNSPASVSDIGAPAAPIVPPDHPYSPGGLADWIAALAGVDPRNPNQFAPPPLDDGLRDFYRNDPTQPREDTDLQALDARLSGSGDIKDAVALYKARKSSRR